MEGAFFVGDGDSFGMGGMDGEGEEEQGGDPGEGQGEGILLGWVLANAFIGAPVLCLSCRLAWILRGRVGVAEMKGELLKQAWDGGESGGLAEGQDARLGCGANASPRPVEARVTRAVTR